jgi:hypothetical protein
MMLLAEQEGAISNADAEKEIASEGAMPMEAGEWEERASVNQVDATGYSVREQASVNRIKATWPQRQIFR